MRIYHNLQARSAELELVCQIYCKYPLVDLCDVNELRRSFSTRRTGSLGDRRPVTAEQISYLNRRMWRFLPMFDPLVDTFVSRDLDAEIIARETAAVQQWLVSNYTFHVMRDHHLHNVPILAGQKLTISS